MEDIEVFPYERVDDLQLGGLRIIQNPSWFCFGSDAVLLSDFASAGIKKDASVLDFCSGNGIIPILLSAKCGASKITGLEILPEVAEMAERSVRLNDLSGLVKIKCGDLKDAAQIFGKSVFDAVTCNPPYREAGGGIENPDDILAVARHEIKCSLTDVISSAAQVLKPGGKLFMIHRPDRLADILCLMRENKIEPKRLRFVHPKAGATANMILAEGARGGRPKLFLEPPLYMYDDNGEYTKEVNKIYGRN